MIITGLNSWTFVVFGCPFVASVIMSDQMLALWKETFDKIFGSVTSDSSLMSDRQLLRAMVFLHTSADDLDAVDEEDKDNIEFWYRKAFGFFAPDSNVDYLCRVDYVQEVFERYEQQNVHKNHNFEQLYMTFRKNIIEFCDNHFSDLPAKLESLIPQEKLESLVNSYREGKKIRSAAFSASVLETVGIIHGITSADLIDAWKNGPCGLILSTLQDLGMRRYANFVDLGLEGEREYLAWCSKPVRFWVTVVGMCRDIDTLMPYTIDKSDPERFHTAEMWKKTYQTIFGSDTGRLSEKQVLRSVAFLREKADQLESIDEGQKSLVRFWHKALSDFSVGDCKVDYLERHAALHDEQNIRNNPNFKRVYLSFIKNMITFCDRNFADLSTRLTSKVSDDNLLSLLNAQSTSFSSPLSVTRIPSNRQLAGALTDSLLGAIRKAEKGDKVIEVWNVGPCGRVLASLGDPEMASYSHFAEMSRFRRRQYLKFCSEPNQVWIRIVDICQLLDNEIPVYANSGLPASSIEEFINMELGMHHAPHLSLLYV